MRRPRCSISARAWERTKAELTRTAPQEGVLVPLVALTARDPDANPCEPLSLESLAEVVIAAVVLVPPELQVNRAAHVHVRPDTDRRLNQRIERLVSRFPRLRACAYLHSHPFAIGTTRPSRGPGCDDEGHMIPLLETNNEAGLETSFSFIACRESRGRGWVLRAFALDRAREIVDLGRVEVVGGHLPLVREALVPAGAESRRALARWKDELARRDLDCAVDELFDGWRRSVVSVARDEAMVLLMPADYPRRTPQLYHVDRVTGATVRLRVTAEPESWLRRVDALREVVHVAP